MKIRNTLFENKQYFETIGKIHSSDQLSVMDAYRINRLVKKLNELNEEYSELKKKLLDQFGTPGEEEGQFTVEGDQREPFTKEMNDLISIEHDLEMEALSWPSKIKDKGQLRHTPGHLIDIMATCVDVARAKYPQVYKNRPILPMEGKSLASVFVDDTLERDLLLWEHEGNRAIRKGNWKLVMKRSIGKWELYNIVTNGTIVTGNSTNVVGNIDDIPWPAWDLLQPEKYPPKLLFAS